MAEPIPFYQRLRLLVYDKGLTVEQFEREAGLDRRILYKVRRHHRCTLMGLAYFFGMTVEELVVGTSEEEFWVNSNAEDARCCKYNERIMCNDKKCDACGWNPKKRSETVP